MGNSSTAGRSSARGKANRYQRTQPPQRQHHPHRQAPSRSQRGNRFQPTSPSRVSPSLNKRHRRLPPSQQQQQQQQLLQHHDSDVEQPPAKRRRVNNTVSNPKTRQQQEPDASPIRPPVKISVTQPHGQLERITNGVRATLQITHDDLRSDDSKAFLAVDDKRILRSQSGGPRSTSDLVQFFPDFEEYVFGDAHKRDLITLSSSLYVTDDKTQPQNLPIRTAAVTLADDGQRPSLLREEPKLDGVANDAVNADANEALDLSAYEKEALDFKKDPLQDSEYFKAHKRGERNEKQMRNVEKERAMHEKSELERLYDELRGADWLKAMGISGITESEKKQYEPKRDHYIGKVKSLLHKFEKWKDKEKEMRVKREKAIAAKAESEDDGDAADAFGEQYEELDTAEVAQSTNEDEHREMRTSKGTRKASTAVNLASESKSQRNQNQPIKQAASKKEKALRQDTGVERWASQQQITSFFAKAHEREAALGKHRRGGRHVTAFGHPLPPMSEEDFGLPEGFLNEDEMRDHARKRRRDKRESLKKE